MRLVVVLLLLGSQAAADVVLPARTLRANTLITFEDLVVKSATLAGTFDSVDDVVGQEARIALYPGRPIRLGDIGPPAIIERNQLVPLIYQTHGLRIATSGRALGRGAVGDQIRVMNLASRTVLFGIIENDGGIHVQ